VGVIQYLHGVESFWRSYQLLRYSRNFQHFVELRDLVPFSHDSSFGPYLVPNQSSLQPPPCFCRIIFNVIFLSMFISSYILFTSGFPICIHQLEILKLTSGLMWKYNMHMNTCDFRFSQGCRYVSAVFRYARWPK
jgi:hypothetical protein